jgi:hypothetical protein
MLLSVEKSILLVARPGLGGGGADHTDCFCGDTSGRLCMVKRYGISGSSVARVPHATSAERQMEHIRDVLR